MNVAPDSNYGITSELCRIENHPNAQCFFAWTCEVVAAMVRARPAWASALKRSVDTIMDASPEAIARFESRMRREPYGFQIWIRLLGDEAAMTECEDAAELLYKFDCKFP